MSQTITIPPIVNSAMKLTLRSPLHSAVSKSIMLITFTGRKSGKTYTTPVSYSEHDGEVYVFTHATWWKNLQDCKPVTLCIRGRNIQGLAQPIAENKQAVAAGLLAHLRKVPADAGFYGVADPRNPKAEELEKAAQTVVMIRITKGAEDGQEHLGYLRN